VTKFAFVAAERANHAVSTLCRVVGVSISGFYAWLRAIPSRQSRAEAEAELRGHISRIFAAKRQVYGAPRIHAELRREGRRHARRRIERLMRDMGLQAQRGQRRRPQTTDSRHGLPVAPNLLGRSFVAERPDTVWLADISYHPTDEGFLYLAAIKDLATREIVGWSMAEHLKAGLCIDALVMALSVADPHGGSFIIATAACNPGSSGRRNSCVRRSQQLVKGLGRCSPAQGFAWPAIEGRSHGCKVLGAVHAEVGALWKVLPQQPVGVLVRAALPRAVGIAEVDRHASLDPELGVLGHLRSPIPRQRPSELLG